MSRLRELFQDMLQNKEHYLSDAQQGHEQRARIQKGEEFERKLLLEIEKSGYELLPPEGIHDPQSSIKEQILNKTDYFSVENTTNLSQHFVHQPYGTQEYPDFLVFEERRILSIETKYSSGNQAKPMWNSGLPRPNGLYVFASHGRQDITFFRGCHILTENEVRGLHRFFEEVKKKQDAYNEMEMTGQDYGFVAYIRKAYDQSKKYSPNAVTNFFTNPMRHQLETAVLEYLEDGDDRD